MFTAVVAAVTPAFLSAPAFAAPAAPAAVSAAAALSIASPVAAGDDFTVTEVPGGYQVTKTLSEPIEVRSDVPTLWADGVELGAATESLDGLTLTVTTPDEAAATATVVDQGWLGSGDPAVAADVDRSAAEQLATQLPSTLVNPVLAADPTAAGSYAVKRLDYNLGDEAEDIRGFNRKGEIRAAVFMPEGVTGEAPVVVFLHGRHTSCTGGTRNPLAWPCGPNQVDVASYLGYNDAAQILASQGYAVVSISANAINALDGTLADDTGALARAQLVMDHLALLRAANEGVDNGLSPELKGHLDLGNVGLMGHSRGGEGIMRAALLNLQQGEPYGIKAVLPLAPTDYTRMTVPGIPTAVVLPYCDGDVEDQMGQKYIDDSRHAYGDDVFRSSVLIMGTNHNFFNTAWTPGKYPVATSDDWSIMDSRQTDPTCGANVSTTRLNSDEQYQAGNAYIAAWFRLTLGGDDEFMPMFDGSDAKPASAGSKADVRVSATHAPSDRTDINLFTAPDQTIQATGAGTYQACVSMSPLDVPSTLPYCVTKLGFAQAPDYGFLSTPYGNGRATSVPSTPSLHFTYTAPASATAAAGQLRIPVPAAASDFSAHESLSFRVSPDDSVAVGGSTDLTVTVVDSKGGTASVTASSFGDALRVLPGSVDPLRKVLLQQIEIPTTAFTGVDITTVQQVRLTAPRAAGGVLLSDLSLLKPVTLGTPELSTRPFVSMTDVKVEEGAGVSYADLPVVLSRPAEVPTTVYVSAIAPNGSSKVLSAMQQVDFAVGEICKPVTVAVQGDSTAGSAASASYITNVSNTQQGATLGEAFGSILVREDDGVVTGGQPGTPLPPVGTQGDACAEALAAPGTLTLSSATAHPGDTITVTGSGFRSGESVSLTLAGASVAAPVVSTDGSVSFTATVPADAAFGEAALTAVGAGSAFTATAALQVTIPVDRIAGADRYEASVAASMAGFPEGAKTVFVASGESFPDALSAAPAAAVAGAPILLTQAGSVSSAVSDEIGRLKASSIVIVGGPNTISPAVEAELAKIAPVERLQGTDRYATSRAIAESAFGTGSGAEPGASTAVLAAGSNFPDALSAGSAIAGQGPVILVDGTASALDAATTDLLKELKVTDIVIAGGEGSVSAGIQTAAAGIATTERLSGADRYASSRAINAHFFTSADRVLLATGEKFPDALAGSALAPKLGAPLFTVPSGCVPAETLAQITALGARQVTLLGGVATLTEAVEDLTPCTAG